MYLSAGDVENLVKCLYCNKTYDLPKLLPCGNNICKSCMITYPFVECKYCKLNHDLKEKKLETNLALVTLIKVYKANESSLHESNVDPSTSKMSTYGDENSLNGKLNHYLKMVDHKINLFNTSYYETKHSIESKNKNVSQQIMETTNDLIQNVKNIEGNLLKDVENRNEEILIDLKHKHHDNENVKRLKKEVNDEYQIILNDLNKTDVDIPSMLEKLELLNIKLDDNSKYIVRKTTNGLEFTKNELPQINTTFIGDIEYDSEYRIDTLTKIIHLNNALMVEKFDFSYLITGPLINKAIALLSRNKIFFLDEKLYGKVRVTTLRIIYYDKTILRSKEVCLHLEIYSSYCIHDKHILIAFEDSRNHFLIHLYDINLKKVAETLVKHNIVSIKMNDNRVYLISDKNPIVYEYDYELNFLKSFGQNKKQKKKFFLKGTIVALNSEKIFVKYEYDLRVVSMGKGELLYKFTFNDIVTSHIFLDYHTEKYIAFNGYRKLSYYNHEGKLITDNKIRIFEQDFDEFQITKSGHFAFVDHKKKFMAII